MQLRSKFFLVTPILGALAMLSVYTPEAIAHKGAKGVVKKRMDAMKSIGDNMKAIKKMLAGEQPYDAGKVKKAAGAIKSHAGKPLVKLFPKGSMQKPTEATPKIWEDWDAFEENAMRLQVYAGVLEASAGRPEGAAEASGLSETIKASDITEGGWPTVAELNQLPLQAVFMAMGKTCKSCHESFRIKKDEAGKGGHEGHQGH